jgi:hypothetical protein
MIELNWLIEKEKKVHEKENLTSIKPVKPVICASGYRFIPISSLNVIFLFTSWAGHHGGMSPTVFFR